MAQLQFAFSDLTELLPAKKDWTVETLTMLGFPAEETKDGGLNVEVTPNRPDALCVEGLARTLRCYRTGKPVKYNVGTSKVGVYVDKSVASVRPFFGGAVVRNIKMTDSLLRSLMQVQEKLHETLGRKRRKVAIGIHDLDRVQLPFRYFACGRGEISFVPLESSEKMTPEQILAKHPKGIAYAHLVGEKCPMITDKNGQVLSFPPIINGELTKITEKTTSLFIDTTGTSGEAVQQAVNILAAMLAERGGRIEEIAVNGKSYALLAEKKWKLPVRESEKLLGVKLGAKKTAALLARMGHRVSGPSVFVPGYRADVMDRVDLVEDAAIAYGFNNFEPSLPGFFSIGQASPESDCHEILVGLGYDEALSWTLANEGLARKAGLPQARAAKIENPLTSDFTIFRPAILPNLLSIMSESKNERLPIRIYEIGPAGSPALEQRLALASMGPKSSFSDIKGAVLALAEAAGKMAEFKAEEYGPYVKGRCAAVYLDGKKAGHAGEISPLVLSNFSLEQPVCAAEIRL